MYFSDFKDYCRPSVEEILQNLLIVDLVSEEQVRILERKGRRSDQDKVERVSGMPTNELKLKEQQLQEKEKAIKEREHRLERKRINKTCMWYSIAGCYELNHHNK